MFVDFNLAKLRVVITRKQQNYTFHHITSQLESRNTVIHVLMSVNEDEQM